MYTNNNCLCRVTGHPNHPGQSLGRKMLTALSTTATDAANAANIWPPRDPVGTGCYGAYCGGGQWGNYGYTQAVPAGGGPGNSFYTPDGYMRPVPLARPMVAG